MAGEVERLSGKLGLDTTDFKTAIAAANRELRVLESGFKASAAAITDWTKDATGLENRAKSLTGQLDIQKAKVDALAAEHKRLAQEHGATSRAAQDAEIKLNKETETLNKMERELNDTERGLQDLEQAEKEAGKAADKAGDSAERMGNDFATSERKAKSLRDVMLNFGRNVSKLVVAGIVAIGAAAIAATVALAGLAAGTIGAASDLNETISKTEVVFGSAAEKVLAFGETSASAIGLSQNAALGAAGTYGNLLRAMGLTEDASADMSIELVELASDLASFNNMKTDEVLEKLRAGLTGESEPLKTLGVNMNEARIKAKALELGLAKQGEELTAAAKAQAAYAIILEDTALAQGDFARTSAGQANQQRIFRANLENLRAKIGQAFLPIVNQATKAINDMLGSPQFAAFAERMIAWFGELATSLQPFVDAVVYLIQRLLGGDGLFTVFEDGSSILGGFFEKLGMGEEEAEGLAQKIIGVADAISTFVNDMLVPFIQRHGKQLLAILAGITAGFAAFSIITTVVGWISGLIGVVTSLAGVFTAAGGGIAGIVAILGGPVTLIIAAVAAAIGLLTAAWVNNWGGIRDTITNIWEQNIKPALQALGEWLSVAIPAAIQVLSEFWTNTLLPALQTFWVFVQDVVFPILQALWDWLSVAIPAALQTLSAFWTGTLLPAIQAVWAFIQDNLFPLFEAIGKFIGAVFNLYLRIMAGLWQNVVLPVLKEIWGFLDANIFPIFRAIGSYIGETFQPILEGLSSFLSGSLAPAFGGIVSAIQAAVDWLTQMATIISGLQLPAWLTPGSPTPWEIGLLGINDAMKELNNQLPTMAKNLDRLSFAGVAGGIGAPSGGSVQNDQFQFFAPVIVQDTQPAGLAAQLKGRRF
jgi:hypothetical protein